MMELELPAQDLTFRGNTITFIFSISFILLNVRITNDAREDEMEENMQQVGSSLGILKNMAEDLGQTIDGQNKQIEKIGAKVTILSCCCLHIDYEHFQAQVADVKVKQANKRTDKLLK